ncbi:MULTISPECIES: YggS family pyridoxal phosphate-dependent enzyme [unclassified Jeotgalibaca]|uniref:YggS family pyridoxal phosphate-dependent enzyme n=1 Tax=unclassified Jeotgalibaca TaxID=2621505 RepID=UPI003FD075BB
MTIVSNCRQIVKTIESQLNTVNRNRDAVTCVAVTKLRTLEETEILYEEGFRHFGENRLEGLHEKQAYFKQADIKWHFIGSLQTRKVKDVINSIDYFHSLDRESLAKEINKRAEKQVSCFVQVNVSGEKSKHGISPDELDAFIEMLEKYPKIKVIGLMTMAPIDADEDMLRGCFKKLKHLQEGIAAKALSYAPCAETSMGMSRDYPIAIQEGATFVRIGSSFFEEIN